MKLRQYIGKCGKTQAQIAAQLGVSQQLVSCWINGLCTPHPKAIIKLAAVLGVTAQEVLECFEK